MPAKAAQRACWRSGPRAWTAQWQPSVPISDHSGPGPPCSSSRFGRTVAMNDTRGTDHGTGGCAFLVGGAVRGGRVIADWPSLRRNALLEGRDLKPTLDLRSVFKGVLDAHLHLDARTLAGQVFPDSSGARPLLGLMRA